MPRVLVTGSTGLVGSALCPALVAQGWTVVRLVRPTSTSRSVDAILWDPVNKTIETDMLNGFDAVIHLAGESIADGRWSDAKKKRIRQSRVDATRFLADTLSRLKNPPKTFVSSSAIGFYGDRGNQTVDETSAPGQSFLAQVCQEWENATSSLQKTGSRVVFVRTGIVLAKNGGALGKMLFPFKMGVGGILGPGSQYMSWIDLDDLVGIFVHALSNPSISGPVNAVSPFPVSNLEFTKTLGRTLSRPTIFPMPAFAARLAFGEMAQELLLTGARVVPTKLSTTGFTFRYPKLNASLEHLLKS